MSETPTKSDGLLRACPPLFVEGPYPPSSPSPGTGVGPYDDPLQQLLQHNAPQPASHGGVLKQTSPPPAAASQPPHSPKDPTMTPQSPPEEPFFGILPGGYSGLAQDIFPYELLGMATDEFSPANFLGEGEFGSVHKGVFYNGKEVVVKKLKAGSVLGEGEFQKEFVRICRVYHPNLVSMVGFCITGSHTLLVHEFVPNNTLKFHLHGGLNIIHCDIKASNILLDSEFVAKLKSYNSDNKVNDYFAQVSDFGLARFVSDFDTHVSTGMIGTNGYLDPEYAVSGKLTEKSDVFSYGVVLLELITGREPVDPTHLTLADWARPLLAQALKHRDFDALVDPRLQNDYDRRQMSLMVACAAACVKRSASHRPKMSQIVPVLQGYAVFLSDHIKRISQANKC